MDQSLCAPIWMSPLSLATIDTSSSKVIVDVEVMFDVLNAPNPPISPPPPPTLAINPLAFELSPPPAPSIVPTEDRTTEPVVAMTVPWPSVIVWVGVELFVAVAPDPPINVA